MPYLSKRFALLLLLGIAPIAKGDWPQFRGPNGAGASALARVPISFSSESKENIAWQSDLPGRGVSGPIVVNGQVISTSSAGIDQRRIYISSHSAKDGKLLWEQQLVARGRPFCHPTSANAAPTPASDGKQVYAFFSSNDLACFDLSGNLIWYRALAVDYPKAGNDVGMSSSPAVADGVVAVQIECQGDAFVAGLDTETGETLWRVDRPKEANWASPTVAKSAEGRSLFVVQCGRNLEGISPKDGKKLWSLPLACSTIPSTAVAGKTLFVPAKGITSLELGSFDQPPNKGWNNNKLAARSSSPVVHENSIYCVNGSKMICGDAQSGEVKWELRLGDVGSVWASPVMTDHYLYLFTQSGECVIVESNDTEGKVVANCKLSEEVLGSPAIDGDAMYVRSISKLWKIAQE